MNYVLTQRVALPVSKRKMSPEDVLSVLLSNKQVVSPSTNQHLPSTHDETPTYRCIGAGSSGVIYEHTGTSFAFKLARHDNPQLWNDYKTHARVLTSFNQHRAPSISAAAAAAPRP